MSSSGGFFGGAGSSGTLIGSVRVELFAETQYATAKAQFFNGPPAPGNGPVEVAQEESGCKLLVPVACPSDCATGTYCSGNKQCVAKPSPVNVGNIRIGGLMQDKGTFDLDPVPPMFAYSGPTLKPYPPCTEGGEVTAEAARFKFSGKCIAALEVTSPLPIPVVSGKPFHMTWKAPGVAGISRVQFALEISHHGGYQGEIDCDVPDTGSFDVPASMVTALMARGLAGFPTVDVNRLSVATDSREPNASLSVLSSAGLLAVDTGVISCTGDNPTECPSPMTCDLSKKICK